MGSDSVGPWIADGAANIISQQLITAPATADSFLEGARRYIESASVLIRNYCAVDTIGLLAAHGLELALKAFLMRAGSSEADLRRAFGHELVSLWAEAARLGLAIETDPPYWVQIVGYFHAAPYQYRYPPEGMATAIPRADLFDEMLREVLAKVERAVTQILPDHVSDH
jgi:hypothetical protein